MQNLDCVVVVPVYNEEASIRKVIREWHYELENWTDNYLFLVINDGSTDGTQDKLTRLQEEIGNRVFVINKPNSGHGQSCLYGYHLAIEKGATWILQIDSDGQCDPQYFHRLWRMREQKDIIYGVRKRRDDGWRRALASLILRTFLLVFFRVDCEDSNAPYRLMRASAIQGSLGLISTQFQLSNIALAVLLKKKRLRHGHVPIRFRERFGGEPHVKMGTFGTKAIELYHQLKSLLKSS